MALIGNVKLTDVVQVSCPVCKCPMNVTVLVDLMPKPPTDTSIEDPAELVKLVTFDVTPKQVIVDHTCNMIQTPPVTPPVVVVPDDPAV